MVCLKLLKLRKGRALAGGAGMMTSLKLSGNIDLPATGFAIGDMTLSDCLEKMIAPCM